MSMARSTPAQKPRGPARRISAMLDFIWAPSLEIVRHPDHTHVRLPATVGPRGVAVGVVLEAVPGVDRGRVGDEDGHAHTAPEEEREVRVDLPHAEVGAARRPGELRVWHEAPEPQEVVARDRGDAAPEGGLWLRVALVEGLDAELERALERAAPTEAVEGQERRADPQVEERDVALRAVALEVELLAVAALEREHVGALGEGLLVVERPRRPAERQERQEPGRERRPPVHGSINTFSASPFAMRSSACRTASSRIRWVIKPSGTSTPHSLEPPPGLADEQHARLPGGRAEPEQAAERPRAEDHDRLAGLDPRALDAEERAGERLGERGARRGERALEGDHVLRDQARRQRDELAVRPVDEEQVLAEVRPSREAEAAVAARRRIRGHDPVALRETPHAGADGGDRPREFVAEDRGDPRDHHGMAAPQRLHVRAAGERGVDPQHELTRRGLGHGELLVAEVPRAVEDHRPHGVTYTLSASRRRIRSTPRSSEPSGIRCVTSRSGATAPLAMSRKASARSAGEAE